MELLGLRVFTEVCRTGSFTAAAAVLGYTQSAVSRQVAALEVAAGARLLSRTARGAVPTAEGEALLPHAEAVLRRVDAGRAAVAAVHRAAGGLLRVGAVPSADAALVPRALARLRRAAPGVEVRLVEAGTRRLRAALAADEVDLAVTAAYPPQDPPAAAEVLLTEPLLVALAAGHPLAGRPSPALADLAGEAWAEHFPHSGETLVAAARAAGFEPDVAFEVREWTGKLGFAAAGLGATLVPAVAASAARADVVLRDVGSPLLARRLLVETRPGAPPAATALAAALRAVAPDLAVRPAPVAAARRLPTGRFPGCAGRGHG